MFYSKLMLVVLNLIGFLVGKLTEHVQTLSTPILVKIHSPNSNNMKNKFLLFIILYLGSTLYYSSLAQQASPAPALQFEGPDQGTTTQYKAGIAGAVGPNHIVTIRNSTGTNASSIYIYNKTGQLVATKSFNNYFYSTISDFSDPRVAYDPIQQRWIATATAIYSGVKHLCVMHSQTSDPTGGWDDFTPIYSFFSSIAQPKIGFSNNWIAVSCYYEESNVPSTITYVWKRQEFYSGSAVTYWTSQAFGMGHLCPVSTYDAGVGDLYLVSVNGSTSGGKVRVSRVYGSTASAPQFNMDGTLINVNNAWNSAGPSAPQLGTSTGIAIPDHRIESAVYRNGSIWFAHNIFLPSSGSNRGLVQWGQVATSTNTLLQLGRIDGGNAGLMYGLPSIAVDQNNNVLVGFNKFSSSGYASSAYAYHYATDPAGSMNNVYTYKNGTAIFSQNWGDYSATVVDPVENAMWTLQQYVKSNNKWGTQWAKIGGDNSGNCASPCGTPNEEWINGITINGNSLPTPGNAFGCITSKIFDGSYGIFKKGISYPISLMPAFAGSAQSEFWRAWIDLNHDGDYDDTGELVYDSGFGSTTTMNANFVIPVSALSGATKLRVSMRRGSPPPLCGNFNYGQVLEYSPIHLIDNDYCDISFYDACAREYIKQVKINSINNSSGCGTSGYQDFTNFSTNLIDGSSYAIQLTPGFNATQYPERWLVWIDFNKDLDFDDPGEKVFDSGATGSTTISSGILNIPFGAQATNTRMRVKMIPAGVITVGLDPCSPVYNTPFLSPDQYGEVEDYTVNIGDSSPIEVVGGQSAEDLVRDVLIGGNCFNITNVTFEGQDGQIGTFSNGLSNVGFADGLIMANGDISVAVGPNDQDNASGGYGISTPDSDLSTLTGGTIFDRAGIEFDFTPTETPLTFEFVFASEEYCEYVNSTFNDVFGFFISGPGFTGTQNIALIPSTSTPVSINTVNHLTNPGYYTNNTPATGTLCGQAPSTSQAVNELQFDGYTKKMVATANVQTCKTYHIKLKIADVGDGIFDSAVFLKAGSFGDGNNASVDFVVNGDPDIKEVYEGCGTVQLIFSRIGGNINLPLSVPYAISGTATKNIDYTGIPTIAVIPAGQDKLILNVNIDNEGFIEGDETIIITLNNACSCTLPQEILTIHDLPQLTAKADTVAICGQGVGTFGVHIGSGVPPFTYHWQTGNTDQTISQFVVVSTSYKVTVTDACGKTVVATARINVTPLPTAQLVPPAPQLCPGQGAVLHVNFTGIPPYTFSYSLNGTTQVPLSNIYNDPYDLIVYEPGLYQIPVVYDNNGCQGTGTGALLVSNSSLGITGVASNISCLGQTNGSINTTVTGGQSPFTYNWSQASIGNVADPIGLPTGNYTVTVVDGFGCSQIQQFTIAAPAALSLSFGNVQGINCNNAWGSIDLNVSGGTPNYTYSWSNGKTTQDLQGLAAGAYNVTVTDVNGCSNIAGTTIIESPKPNPSIYATALCVGSTSTLSVSGGTFNSYAWSNGQSGAAISVSAPGIYTVTVTDIIGCTGTASQTLTISQPTPAITGAPSFCPGGNTILTVSGPGFSAIQWSTGNNGSSISVSTAGTYTVTVTNTAGCTNTASQSVSTYVVTTPSISGPVGVCMGGISTLTVAGNYANYKWSTGEQGPNLQVSGLGTYTVTVTDANFCTGTTSHAVNEIIPSPTPVIQGPSALCSGLAILSVAGYSNWSWSNGVTGTPNIVVTNTGTYIVTVTGANGCTGTTSHSVNFASPTASISGDFTLCPGATVNLMANGVPPGNTVWKNLNGQILGNGSELLVNQVGTYIAEISSTSGGNSCTASDTVQVTLASAPVATATGGIISCVNPEIVIGAGPYAPGISFEWSGPANFMSSNPFAQVSMPGVYVVTVSNADGCSSTASAVVSLEDKTNTFEILPATPIIDNAPAILTDLVIPSSIQNHEGNSIDIEWTKTLISLTPLNCEVKVEDKIAIYPSIVNTGQFTLNPNEIAPLNVHLIDSEVSTCYGMVKIRFRNLCTLRDSLVTVYSSIVPTSEIKADNMTVIPNPSSGNFKFLDVPIGVKQLEIIGVDGKLILKQALVQGDHNLDLSGNKPGTYFAIIRDRNEDLVRVFVLVLVE
jgi:hypothetical protein